MQEYNIDHLHVGDILGCHSCFVYSSPTGFDGTRNHISKTFIAIYLGEISSDPWWGKQVGVKILSPEGVCWVLIGSIDVVL